MNHSTIYSKVSGRLPEKDETKEKEAAELNDSIDFRLREVWLKDQLTKEYLDKLRNDFDTCINRAMNYAILSNDKLAINELIKAKTITESIKYATRTTTN